MLYLLSQSSFLYRIQSRKKVEEIDDTETVVILRNSVIPSHPNMYLQLHLQTKRLFLHVA